MNSLLEFSVEFSIEFSQDEFRPGEQNQRPTRKFSQDEVGPGEQNQMLTHRFSQDEFRAGEQKEKSTKRNSQDEFIPGVSLWLLVAFSQVRTRNARTNVNTYAATDPQRQSAVTPVRTEGPHLG